ncbi:MAG: sigma-70 family RNA polymerase sigma factor [gamma proteobacterium symbiont of Ctena orbiculata]
MEGHGDPDLALLERIARKDKAAFKALYRQLYQPIYQYLFRMLQRREVCEELVDDVLLTVWQKAGDFRGRSKVRTWVIGIAYRKGLKRYHREARGPQMDELEQHAHRLRDEEDAGPEGRFQQQQLGVQLQTGLMSLSANHRSVMELTMLGYSCNEIASIVDCPVNTVKTRMFHARRQLREYLGQLDPRAAAGRGEEQ